MLLITCAPVARLRATHFPACIRVTSRPRTHTARARAPCRVVSRNALPRAQRTAPDPGCMRVSPRSRGLAGVCMPSHAHTSPALNSCPSVCRQHTGPGSCQCLLVCERCRRQPRRTVTRGLLRGRVFAHPHKRVPKSQVVMQGWARELPQGQQASRQAVLLPGSGSVRCPHLQDLKNRIIRTAHLHHPQHRMAAQRRCLNSVHHQDWIGCLLLPLLRQPSAHPK